MSVTEAPAFGGGTETLVYDGLGQRVQKTVPGGTTVYVYDAFGQLTAEYSTVPNTPQCTTCYLSYDHLGSVRLVTDATNNVIARHDYLPFGEEIPGGYAGRGAQWGAPDGLTQRFTGQIRDSETGQDYFNARYFTGALGRFNSPDPFTGSMDLTNPQTLNRYAYALNNPLSFIDPFGLDACEDEDGGDDSSSCSNTPDSSGTYHCTVFLSCGDLPSIAQQPPPDQIIDIPPTPNIGIDSGEPDPNSYDVVVGLDIWQGQQQLWRNTARVGNALGVATVAVTSLPIAVAGTGSAASGIAGIIARGIGWAQGLFGGTGVVLGTYSQVNNYIDAGESLGANYFNLSPRTWSALNYFGQAWTANRSFLDASMVRGQQFWLSTNPLAAQNYFAMELRYLTSRGIGPDRWKMVPLPLR